MQALFCDFSREKKAGRRSNGKQAAPRGTACLMGDGAGNEARTRYLHLGKVALYQMSYARMNKTEYSKNPAPCQAFF